MQYKSNFKDYDLSKTLDTNKHSDIKIYVPDNCADNS